MNNKFDLIKKIISYFPLINRLIRGIYNYFNYRVYFVPIRLDSSYIQIIKRKISRFDLNNFNRLKEDYDYFLIFQNKSLKNYSHKKLEKLINLITNEKSDVAYDGDDPNYTEIATKKFLENYISKQAIHRYPYRFFYFKENFKISNLGSKHRSFNFNGTFILPSGGKTIGDGGSVANRLNFIPNLKDKTFLDVGSEEGYAVFDALKKNAKFAKGLNIEETKEYDFFPEHFRPTKGITSRDRDQINKTQNFLKKEYNLEESNKIQFAYNNIYKLDNEKFDFVFCFGVLYHLKNPYLALENLFKVTNETLLIETQGIKSEKYLNAKIDKGDGFVRHSSKALQYLLKMVGFSKVSILVDAYDPSMRIMNIVLKAEK